MPQPVKCLLKSTCPVPSAPTLKPEALTGLRLISFVFKPFLNLLSTNGEGLTLQFIVIPSKDNLGTFGEHMTREQMDWIMESYKHMLELFPQMCSSTLTFGYVSATASWRH